MVPIIPFHLSKPSISGILNLGASVEKCASQTTHKFVANHESPIGKPIYRALEPPDSHGPVNSVGNREAELGTDVPTSPEEVTVTADTQTDTPIPPSDTVKDEEDRFKKAMIEYETTAEEKYRTGITPDETFEMEQLWKIIDEQQERYKKRGQEGLLGKIRYAFRKLGDGNVVITGWLGLLPSQSQYMSLICGGCTMVIKAAGRMRDVANAIFDALCRIPVILGGAKRVLRLHSDSKRLKDLSDELYTSILGGLGYMMEYLKRKSSKKLLKAFFKQGNFESRLEEKIKAISAAKDAFNEEAEMCHKEAVQSLVHLNEGQAGKIQKLIDIHEAENKRTREEDLLLNQKSQIVLDLVIKLLNANEKGVDMAWAESRRLDTPDPDPHTMRQPERRASRLSIVTKRKKKSTGRLRQEILNELDYDPDATANDVLYNYKLGPRLPIEEQRRILFVIKSSTLANFVKIEQSSCLVINGNAPKPDRRSGLSFVCARLAYVLDSIQSQQHPDGPLCSKIIPLSFFCGQHIPHEQDRDSPSGIVNSLIAQLLTHSKDVKAPKGWRSEDFQSDDIEMAFSLFKSVVKQLPSSTTIFCVIDALSYYINDDEMEEDAQWLARKLIKLTEQQSEKRPVFKLLLTAPVRLPIPVFILDALDMLNIPQCLPKTGGFTERQWESGLGEDLDSLVEI